MRIVEIREDVAPISSSIRNAYIDFSGMTASIVAIVTDVRRDGKPVIGFGFNSNGRYAQQGLLRERFIPRLLEMYPEILWDEAGLIDPFKAWDAMMGREKPGGHGERSVAVGVLDMALWDAIAKAEGVPLWKLLADRYRGGCADETVWVYAAGGYYYPDDSVGRLQDELRTYLELGYETVKIKIGGKLQLEDLWRIDAALKVVGSPWKLCVDANGRFSFESAMEYARMLAKLGVRWYEEPLEPLDFLMHAALVSEYSGPIATGENLFSMYDARNLIRHGGLRPGRDVLQFDPALSYGLVEYLRTLEMLEKHGWSRRSCVPHGGHQFALNIAAGLGLGGNESYPQVFAPFGGFADGYPVEDGRVHLPEAPGIGFELKADLWKVLSALVTDLI